MQKLLYAAACDHKHESKTDAENRCCMLYILAKVIQSDAGALRQTLVLQTLSVMSAHIIQQLMVIMLGFGC